MAPIQCRVRVSFGKSFEPQDLSVANINDDLQPDFIETGEFVGRVLLRAKGLDKVYGYHEGQKQDGLPSVPDSPWFSLSGGSDRLCLQIQGRFKREWAGDDVLFGSETEQLIQMPACAPMILRLIQFVDPSLKADFRCKKPWAMSPVLACMNTIQVQSCSLPTSDATGLAKKDRHPETALLPWPSPNGEHLKEDTRLLFQEEVEEGTKAAKYATNAMSVSARRSYFAKSKNLGRHRFLPGQVYNFAFHNAFLDVTDFTVGIGGLKLDLSKYWDGKKIRVMMRSAGGSVMFMAMLLELVPVNA